MSFFQNVFTSDFVLPIAVGDRQYSPTYKLATNSGRGPDLVIAWEEPNYDLSGNDGDGNATKNLTIGFAIDPEFKNWAYLTIDITAVAASSSAVTAAEIVNALNANATFAERFEAFSGSFTKSGKDRVSIRQNVGVEKMRFYIVNGTAESVLRFNARAGVAELPTFFEKHTIDNRFNADSIGMLILLDDSGSSVDQDIIDNAVNYKGESLGFSHSTVQADWQLLKGTSVLFTFKNQTVDGSDRVTQIIEYPAGAVAGDLAKKTIYTYSGANTSPSTILEIPYVLAGGDLVTP